MRLRGISTASWLVRVLALLPLFALSPGAGGAETPTYTPYQHRAWYIYLISQYTQWPDSAFTNSPAPFVLGILGEDPFHKDLNLIIDKPVKGHRLKVRYFKRGEVIEGCHALYIADSETDQLGKLLPPLAHRPILTFGEMKGFLKHDGIVKLWVRPETSDQGYLYFQINNTAAEQARLRISSYVLKLAKPEPPSP